MKAGSQHVLVIVVGSDAVMLVLVIVVGSSIVNLVLLTIIGFGVIVHCHQILAHHVGRCGC
jgi:hypothetical protein